jgi:23S rRNA (uracil1939-C5)-methyltransferase
MEDIAHLRPSRIVYISCNPATLARDVRSLSQKGYSVQRLALIDMFPQTYHMEVVALLRLAVP